MPPSAGAPGVPCLLLTVILSSPSGTIPSGRVRVWLHTLLQELWRLPTPASPPRPVGPPVGHDAGVIGLLVLVHLQVTLADEALLLPEGPDDTDPQQGLVEVGVNRGAADGLEALQLPGGGHVEPLGAQNGQGVSGAVPIPAARGCAGGSLDADDAPRRQMLELGCSWQVPPPSC